MPTYANSTTKQCTEETVTLRSLHYLRQWFLTCIPLKKINLKLSFYMQWEAEQFNSFKWRLHFSNLVVSWFLKRSNCHPNKNNMAVFFQNITIKEIVFFFEYFGKFLSYKEFYDTYSILLYLFCRLRLYADVRNSSFFLLMWRVCRICFSEAKIRQVSECMTAQR